MHDPNKNKAAVLLLIFNRPENTIRVLNQIKKYKPSKLFIGSDGHRPKIQVEKKIIEDLRTTILDLIDWPCEVKTLFRKENLGCKYAVSGAIDWFFESVEEGIILEDDCLPSLDFFYFCESMLQKYKDTAKVLSICGYNTLGSFKSKHSYFFSKYFFVWGWATWKDAWKRNDLELQEYRTIKNNGSIKKIFPLFVERIFKTKKINNCLNGTISTWDIQWDTVHQITSSYSIVPKHNLIENIGFSEIDFTHTKENKWDRKFLCQKIKELEKPLNHPSQIETDPLFLKLCLVRDCLRVSLKKMI